MQASLGDDETVLGCFKGFRGNDAGKQEKVDLVITDEYVHFEGLRIPYSSLTKKKVRDVKVPGKSEKERERYIVEHKKFGSLVNTFTELYDDSLTEERKVELEFQVAELLVEKEGEVMEERELYKRRTLEPMISSRRDSSFEFFTLKEEAPLICLLREDLFDPKKINVVMKERSEYSSVKELFSVQESDDVFHETVKDFRETYTQKEQEREKTIAGIKKSHEDRARNLDVQYKDHLRDINEKMKQRDFIHKKDLTKLTDKYGKTMKVLHQSSMKMRNDYEDLVQRVKTTYQERLKAVEGQAMDQIKAVMDRHQTLMKDMNDKFTEQIKNLNERYTEQIKVIKESHKEYCDALNKERNEYEEVFVKEHEETVGTLEKEYVESVDCLDSQLNETATLLQEEHASTIQVVEEKHAGQVNKMEEENTLTYETLTKEYSDTINLMERKHNFAMDKMTKDHEETITVMKKEYEETIELMETEHTETMEITVNTYDKCLKEMTRKSHLIFTKQREEAKSNEEQLEEEHRRSIETMKSEFVNSIETSKKEHETTVDDLKNQHEETVEMMEEGHENTIKTMTLEHTETVKNMEEEYELSSQKQSEEHLREVEFLKTSHKDEIEHRENCYSETLIRQNMEHEQTLAFYKQRFERAINGAGQKYNAMETKYLDHIYKINKENEYLRDTIFTRERQVDQQENKFEELGCELNQMRKSNEEVVLQNEKLVGDYGVLENHCKRVQNMFVDCTEEISRLREECKRLDELRREAEAALLPYVERVKFLETRLEERESEILMLQRHLQEHVQYRNKLIKENKFLRSRFKLLKQTIKELSCKMNMAKERNDKYEKILTQVKVEKSSSPYAQQRKAKPISDSANLVGKKIAFSDDHFLLKRLERSYDILERKHTDLKEKYDVLFSKHREIEKIRTFMKKVDRKKNNEISLLKMQIVDLEKKVKSKDEKARTLHSKLMKLAKEHQSKETNLQFLEAKMIEVMNSSFEMAQQKEAAGGQSGQGKAGFRSPQFFTSEEQVDRFRHVPMKVKSEEEVLQLTTPTPVSQSRLNDMIYGDDPVVTFTPMSSVGGFKKMFGQNRRTKSGPSRMRKAALGSGGKKKKQFRSHKGVQTLQNSSSSPSSIIGNESPRTRIDTSKFRTPRKVSSPRRRNTSSLNKKKRSAKKSPRMSPRKKERENITISEEKDSEEEESSEESSDEEEIGDVLVDASPLNFLVSSPKKLGDLLL